MTLIQCFGSAFNLNVNFHLLFLDDAYTPVPGAASFRRVKSPIAAELDALIPMHQRAGRVLPRASRPAGRDMENSCLTLESGDDAVISGVSALHVISLRVFWLLGYMVTTSYEFAKFLLDIDGLDVESLPP